LPYSGGFSFYKRFLSKAKTLYRNFIFKQTGFKNIILKSITM